MLIGVIHSEDRYDRLKQFQSDFREQGIEDYLVFPAIFETTPQHGINKAHKQVIQYAKDYGFSEVCVMEDDVRFTHPNSFSYFLQNKPQDFDIYLAGIYLGEIDKNKRIKNDFAGFHCYIVNEKFYDTYLSVPDTEHIDRALEGLGDYYVCHPFAAIQYNGFSDNTKRKMSYDFLLERWELYKG